MISQSFTKKVLVKDIIIQWLMKMGIKFVFGIPGSYNLPLLDALQKANISFILSQSEYGAALMAEGYAKANEQIGCVITTAGASATNTFSSIANSYTSSVPILLITAQVPTTAFHMGGLQDSVGKNRKLNLEENFKAITKYSQLIRDENQLLTTLEEAEIQMVTGRQGPVHINIPVDLLNKRIEFDGFHYNVADHDCKWEIPNIEQVVLLLEQAEQPLLLLGGGCQYRKNINIINNISAKGIPVITTLRGKGLLDESNSLSLGCIGFYGNSFANYYLAHYCDLIIAIGLTFSEHTTQCWDSLFNKINMIEVNIDEDDFYSDHSLKIHSDSFYFLTKLEDTINDKKIVNKEKVEAKILESKRRHPNRYKLISDQNDLITPDAAVQELQKLMPLDNTVWVIDPILWTETNLSIKGANKYIDGLNQTSIGYAPAAAIGAKLALPESMVVSVFGDGGFHQTGFEIFTAYNYNISVLWANLNNNCYGVIKNAQKAFYESNFVGSVYKKIDYVKYANALGIEALKISSLENLTDAVKDFINNPRPLFLDIQIIDIVPDPKFRQLIRYKSWNIDQGGSGTIDMELMKKYLVNKY